ncbi:MAG: hypothetical protein ACLPWS_07585 [Rhodomicrobium sp.]
MARFRVLLLPRFIRAPDYFGRFDIAFLRLLVPAAEQNHEFLAVLPEIDAIAGTLIYLALENAFAHTFRIREVALLHAGDLNSNLRRSPRLKRAEPASKGAPPFFVQIFNNRNRHNSNSYVTNVQAMEAVLAQV